MCNALKSPSENVEAREEWNWCRSEIEISPRRRQIHINPLHTCYGRREYFSSPRAGCNWIVMEIVGYIFVIAVGLYDASVSAPVWLAMNQPDTYTADLHFRIAHTPNTRPKTVWWNAFGSVGSPSTIAVKRHHDKSYSASKLRSSRVGVFRRMQFDKVHRLSARCCLQWQRKCNNEENCWSVGWNEK